MKMDDNIRWKIVICKEREEGWVRGRKEGLIKEEEQGKEDKIKIIIMMMKII